MQPVWIKCQDGWVRYKRMHDGRYYVTATRFKPQTVPPEHLNLYVREVSRCLGGRALHQPAAKITR